MEVFISNLHDDLLIEFLKRFPPKSVLKLLTVSKSFKSLITTPHFMAIYRRHHRRLKPFFIHFEPSKFLNCIDPYNLPTPFQNLPSPAAFDGGAVAGSTNVVICLFNLKGEVCLWNPTIHKHLNLHSLPMKDDQPNLSFGFGFDSSSNDFKVVALSYLYSMDRLISRPPPCAHVLSLSSRSWRTIGSLPGSCDKVGQISKAIFVGGVVYWVISYAQIGSRFEIWTFDIHTESFGKLEFPPELHNKSKLDPVLATVDDVLALLHKGTNSESEFHVWLLKKEKGVASSWCLTYKIKLPMEYLSEYVDNENSKSCMEKRWKNEAFIVTCDGEMIVFDKKKKPGSVLVDAGYWPCDGHVFNYTESLALVDK